MDAIRIKKDSGKIIEFLYFSEASDFYLNQSEEYPLIEGTASPTAYYLDGEFVERPTFALTVDKSSITADGHDVITISGLPDGACQVMLWGAVVDSWEQEGDIQLTANLPGNYQLTISQWPYQDQEISFDAT